MLLYSFHWHDSLLSKNMISLFNQELGMDIKTVNDILQVKIKKNNM